MLLQVQQNILNQEHVLHGKTLSQFRLVHAKSVFGVWRWKPVYCFSLVGDRWHVTWSVSRLRFEAIDTVLLLLSVGEANQANCSLSGAAVLPGPGDRVTNATVGQPSSVTTVVSQQLPGSKYMAHLCDLSSISHACVDSLIIVQLLGLDQVVKAAWDVKQRVF